MQASVHEKIPQYALSFSRNAQEVIKAELKACKRIAACDRKHVKHRRSPSGGLSQLSAMTI